MAAYEGRAASPPRQKSLEAMQETSKWIITSSAVVAGVLVAGLGLGELGSVGWPRMAVSVFAVLLALLAVWVSIREAARVLTVPPLTSRRIAERLRDATDRAVRRPGPSESEEPRVEDILGFDPILASLHSQRIELLELVEAETIQELLVLRSNARKEGLPWSGKKSDKEAWDRISETFEAIAIEGQRIVARQSYDRLVGRLIPLAGLCLVASVSVVGWALSVEDVRGIQQPEGPVAATLILSTTVSPQSLGLGSECDQDEFEVQIVAGSLERPVIAMPRTSQGRCAAAMLKIDNSVGTVIPKSSPRP